MRRSAAVHVPTTRHAPLDIVRHRPGSVRDWALDLRQYRLADAIAVAERRAVFLVAPGSADDTLIRLDETGEPSHGYRGGAGSCRDT